MGRPGFWDQPEKAQKVQRDRSAIESTLTSFKREEKRIEDAEVLCELGLESKDDSVDGEIRELAGATDHGLQAMELRRMMSGEHDASNALIEIHSGAGGTDAQDWAQILLRMYTRWIDRHGFTIEVYDEQPGEEAGLSSVTLVARGPYAYGWLRAEAGVHRLVRISPFDANHRRHTAFAAVYIFPELDDEVDVDIDWEKDVREDRFRSSGAGGQHVNKTESAIRLTHLPTGIVVQCQNERSQHKNRSTARKLLTSRLYDLRLREQQDLHNSLAGPKSKIEFGSQIRSYVAHPYRLVKDHRTGFELSNTDAVLDGELDGFMEAFLLGKQASATDAARELD
jgi:peptide chain release factor 2